MKKIEKIVFLFLGFSLCFVLGGCQNKQDLYKQTIAEKYNGVGEAYAKDIVKNYPKIDQDKYLSVCLYKVDTSNIKGNEEITFITNKCIKELKYLLLGN